MEQCLTQANGENSGGMIPTAVFRESNQLPRGFGIVPEAPDVVDRGESNRRTPETAWKIGFASLTQRLVGGRGSARHAASRADELKQRVQRISWMGLNQES